MILESLQFVPAKSKGPGDCESEVFIAKVVDGVGDKWSGATTVNVETPLETFLGDFQIWDISFVC
jgi:hypothetical protein